MIEPERKELKLKSRKSRKPHKLPQGWRWLKIGERAEAGDVVCDPRIWPVEILPSGWIMTKDCHPVRRKLP